MSKIKQKLGSKIYSLDDSDIFSHRRSNSTFSPKSPNNKYYLTEKNNENNRVEFNTNKILNIKDQSTKNQEYDLKPISRDKKIEHSDSQTHYEDSFNFSVRSSDRFTSSKMRGDLVLNEKFKNLNEKYMQIKDKYNFLKAAEKNWRSSYFSLLKDSLGFEDVIKTLMEENRIHQEYIISMENKVNKVLTSCNNITSNFHTNMYKSISMNNNSNADYNNSCNARENISNLIAKNYNEVLNDYKRQLEILAEEKENLSTNLSISRHQQLQKSMKLEEWQTRLYNLEQARMEDLKLLESLRKDNF